MILFALIFMLSSAVITFILLVSTLRKNSPLTTDSIPAGMYTKVSILKPVKRADRHFEANLKTFYEQDYPDFEIILGIETQNEPEVEIVERVSRQYPSINTVIVFTGTDKELNPKVDNLMKMEEHSKGTHYWIADANVRVDRNVLSRLMNESVQKGAKLVFCPIVGSQSNSLASLAENMHISFTVSGLIIGAWSLVGRQITVGKSMLVERRTLETDFGGFSYFLKYLAEDYILGKEFDRRRIVISTNNTWITNVNSDATFRTFFKRMSRWSVMRFHIDRKWYFAELLSMNPTLFAFGLMLSGKALLIQAAIALILFKALCEFISFRLVNRSDSRRFRNIAMFIPAFFAKEVLIACTYLVPFFSNSVDWKGNRIRVGKDSMIGTKDIDVSLTRCLPAPALKIGE